jgi:hypothetical protein
MPKAPWSSMRSSSAHNACNCGASGSAVDTPITAMRSAPWPTSGAAFMARPRRSAARR